MLNDFDFYRISKVEFLGKRNLTKDYDVFIKNNMITDYSSRYIDNILKECILMTPEEDTTAYSVLKELPYE